MLGTSWKCFKRRICKFKKTWRWNTWKYKRRIQFWWNKRCLWWLFFSKTTWIFLWSDNGNFVQACNFFSPNGDSNECTSFLYSDQGKNIMTNNSLWIWKNLLSEFQHKWKLLQLSFGTTGWDISNNSEMYCMPLHLWEIYKKLLALFSCRWHWKIWFICKWKFQASII